MKRADVVGNAIILVMILGLAGIYLYGILFPAPSIIESGITWKKTDENNGESVELSADNIFEGFTFVAKFSNLDPAKRYFLYFITDDDYQSEVSNFENVTERYIWLEGKQGRYLLCRKDGQKDFGYNPYKLVIVIRVIPELICGVCL